MVRATPAFGPLVRHAGGQRGTGVGTPFAPLAGRSLSPQRSLAGRTEMLKTYIRVVPLNPALTASGLRTPLSLWPGSGEVVMTDLVRGTEPLGQELRPLFHQRSALGEEVRASIGLFHGRSDTVRE